METTEALARMLLGTIVEGNARGYKLAEGWRPTPQCRGTSKSGSKPPGLWNRQLASVETLFDRVEYAMPIRSPRRPSTADAVVGQLLGRVIPQARRRVG